MHFLNIEGEMVSDGQTSGWKQAVSDSAPSPAYTPRIDLKFT